MVSIDSSFTELKGTLLISRTDAIGDVVLSLPLLGLLKQYHPELTLLFLGRDYTLPILQACQHLDQAFDWVAWQQLSAKQQRAQAKAFNIDYWLHLLPNRALSRLSFQAGVPYRFGTAHRWYHWLW